jgi:2-polyprenyl-3-methyl-5-hydroxy-6-metoxy-1,4-benzoquinol methylase
LLENGYTPVILDWDYRSVIPNQIIIFCPDKNNPLWGGQTTGDANILAALSHKAAFFIGIDSGPAHIAAATKTQGIVIWTQHHPVNFFDLNNSFTHLIPLDVRNYVKVGGVRRNAGEEIDKAIRYFEKRYIYKHYRDLQHSVLEVLRDKLDISHSRNPMLIPKMLKTVNYGEAYYKEHLAAGLDYLSFGNWQRDYARWLNSSLNLQGKSMLDVGCACGSITNGFHEVGMVTRGCDVNEHCIRLGREKWGHLKLHICDAVNLHHFPDESFDFIHLMQTAEHFRPELVSFILKELSRVTKPNALLFSVHDTIELFEKQKRDDDDPTHTCVKPRDWWDVRFGSTGWIDCRDEYSHRLHGQDSFFKVYDWDWFLYRFTKS